ncbi:MAG: hypothetical protein AAF959_18680 [Cyanobacteria bacterium P01_D01_bin.56]
MRQILRAISSRRRPCQTLGRRDTTGYPQRKLRDGGAGQARGGEGVAVSGVGDSVGVPDGGF